MVDDCVTLLTWLDTGLPAGLPANSPVQLVYSEKSPPCQSWRNIGHHPNLVNGKSILVECVHWLSVYYDVP